MTVVKINAIEVPEGAGAELEKRFAARAGAVESSPGFEGFQLLRPVEGESRYFVMTWWESEEAFQGWMNSQDFAKGHANAGPPAGGGHPEGHPGGGEGAPRPVATGSSLLGFEVVERVDPPSS
jgi:heme oxygenase (mycobilin-producing)